MLYTFLYQFSVSEKLTSNFSMYLPFCSVINHSHCCPRSCPIGTFPRHIRRPSPIHSNNRTTTCQNHDRRPPTLRLIYRIDWFIEYLPLIVKKFILSHSYQQWLQKPSKDLHRYEMRLWITRFHYKSHWALSHQLRAILFSVCIARRDTLITQLIWSH